MPPSQAPFWPTRVQHFLAHRRSFEGAVAACAAPLVGWLARYQFGFSGTAAVGPDPAENLANARSLGSALLAFTAVPWTLCLLFLTPLHWT